MATKQEDKSNERKPAFKADLDVKIIKGLSLAKAPTGYSPDGKLVFKQNPALDKDGKPLEPALSSYIIWDSNQAAPPGFGIRIASKKTYIIRRKVLGRSIMPTVGNFSDFATIDEARRRAAVLALKMVETGKNPNAEARKIAASEFTLRMAFARYREHLTLRTQKPAKPETLKVIDRVVRRFDEWKWLDCKIKDFTSVEIVKKFDEHKALATANEQRFRWAIAAINWNIDREKFDAHAANRQPSLDFNPFEILVHDKKFRDQTQLDKEREEKSKRNPLGPTTTLGPFLEACWSKKNTNDNETGIHFAILMLLWGCRKSEHAQCVWGELLPESANDKPDQKPTPTRRNTSHVWLDDDPQYGPYVFFHNTKNGRNHRMPIGRMAVELLRRRQVSAAEEAVRRGFAAKSRQFVFPAKNKTSKTGHYTDVKDLLDRIRDEVGLIKLNRHDLRRSFGAVMTSLDVPEAIKRSFFNHTAPNVTATYTKAEWELLRTWMERIEQSILSTAPNVFNSLKPVDWPPLAAPDPHVCMPPKPRPGRPSKGAAAKIVPTPA